MTDLITAKEMASVFGTAESTIRNKAKELFPSLIENGKKTYFNQDQVQMIKDSLIPRDLTLKSKLESVSTDLEMERKAMEVMAWMGQKILVMQAQLVDAQPKIDFYDSVTSSKDAVEMKDAAKVLGLGIGRNTLFQKLRDKSILMDNNTPYQTYIDQGYFRVIESKWVTPGGETRISFKTVVYQKGLNYLLKVLKKDIAKDLTV